jgi:hypothetical protein
VTPETADWVYAVVLTKTYLRSVGAEGRGDQELSRGPAAVRDCPCEWGPCGHCAAGRIDRCGHRTIPAWPKPSPATYVVARDGAAVASVWRVGRPCQWRCPGPPAGEQIELFAGVRQVPRDRAPQPEGRAPADDAQLSLFDLAGGAR